MKAALPWIPPKKNKIKNKKNKKHCPPRNEKREAGLTASLRVLIDD